MTHFALVCPPFHSHVRLFEIVGARLAERGHRATLLLPEGVEASLEGEAVRVERLRLGPGIDLRAISERAGRPTGPFGILRTVNDSARLTDAFCREAPAILGRIGAQAIVGDQMEPGAGLVARHLDLPQVSVASALPLNFDPAVPPPFVDWRFDPSPEGLKRNRGAQRVTRIFLRAQRRTIREWAMRFALGGIETIEDCLSPLATLSQTVHGFDYPRRGAAGLHHVGPMRDDRGAEENRLPFEIDPAKPLVYASLGTLQGHRLALFRTIAEACRQADVQLVLAHCGGLDDHEARTLPALHVAADLPQRAVLRRADVCITHGGLNTALDALELGVPLLALPIAFDQPGVAARIERSGAGLKLAHRRLSVRTVRLALARLLGEAHFRERARAIGAEIAAAGGAPLAASIIEDVVRRARAATVPAQFKEAAE